MNKVEWFLGSWAINRFVCLFLRVVSYTLGAPEVWGSFGQYITISVDVFGIGPVTSRRVSKSLMPEVCTSNIYLTMLNDREYLVGTMFQCSLQNNWIIWIHLNWNNLILPKHIKEPSLVELPLRNQIRLVLVGHIQNINQSKRQYIRRNFKRQNHISLMRSIHHSSATNRQAYMAMDWI